MLVVNEKIEIGYGNILLGNGHGLYGPPYTLDQLKKDIFGEDKNLISKKETKNNG